jgi:hypothetical protein
MIWLIYIINIVLWGIAAVILAVGLQSALFGVFYFGVGYPLSLVVLKYSGNYAVSYLDRLKYPPFTIWKRKLLWSNGVASCIIWVLIFILALIFKLIE